MTFEADFGSSLRFQFSSLLLQSL